MKTMKIAASLLFTCASGAIAGINPPFESARAQSHRDLRIPEGMEWKQKNAAEGRTKLTPVIKKCSKTTPDGKNEKFTLLMRLSKHGMPLNVLVSPRTKFSECVRSGVSNFNFSNAPWEGYWMNIETVQ
jgi:hypothetical protein